MNGNVVPFTRPVKPAITANLDFSWLHTARPRTVFEEKLDLARFANADVPLDEMADRCVLDKRLLEFYLASACGTESAGKTADRLIEEFGSLAEIAGASLSQLVQRGKLTRRAASAIKMFHLFMERTLRSDVVDRPLLSSYSKLIAYCRMAMAYEEREILRLIFLNVHYRVMDEMIYSRGTIAHCPVYPQEIVREALARCAPCLVMVHNHPSGDAMPSSTDIETSQKVSTACDAVGLTLIDSIVVARGGSLSMRSANLLQADKPSS